MMRCINRKFLKCMALAYMLMINPLWANKPPLKISLSDAVLLSLRYSPFVKSAEMQRVIDKFDLSVARNQFEFQYALTGFANQTNTVADGGPLNILGTYNAQPTITKESVFGTQYSLTMSNLVTHNKIPGFQSTFYNPAVTFQMLQPILRGSGREIVQANLSRAINIELGTEIAYKAAMMDKITQVVEDYRNVVVAINSLEIARTALEASRVTVKENAARIRLGFMAPSENIQALSFAASQELQVTTAEYTVTLTKANLLRDMGLDPSSKIHVDTKIAMKEVPYPKGEEAKAVLFTQNTTYAQALYVLKNSKINLLQAQDKQRWILNLTSTVVQGNGVGGNGNDGLQSLYNGRNSSRSLGLELNVPIDNLPLQQELVSAKVNYTQQELGLKDLTLAMEANLISTLENLRILYLQVKIARQAQELSYRSYQDALKKVGFGQSSMFEVTTLQQTWINDQLTTINTEIAYLNGVTEYQRFLGITLDVWNINLVY